MYTYVSTYVHTYRILQQAYVRSLFYLTAVSCHFIAAAYYVSVAGTYIY